MTAEGEAGPGAASGAEASFPDTFAADAPDPEMPDPEMPDPEMPAAEVPAAETPAHDTPAPTPASDGARWVSGGIAYLEQAIAAFGAAAESTDPDIAPLAIELLARTLPLCERDEESALVWQHGLEHPNPVIAEAVRQRLRRSFGSDEAAGQPSWWEGFVESAVCHSSLPLLANEVFGALDHIYALNAVPLARGGARTRELRDVLAEAVRVPSGYAWGEELLASFRARFRDITGTDAE
jgi:hypothetical protein